MSRPAPTPPPHGPAPAHPRPDLGQHDPDLGHHGDVELAPGLVDLAVNVQRQPMPAWLREPILASMETLTAYPDPDPARAAVAARHRRPADEVLLTAGAAEGFVLLAQAFREARRPVVVHPQFTEPEAALRAAGHRVERVLLRAGTGFRLDPELVPADADLVFVGNPTNPTSVLHPADVLASLARPGRVLVVDEAFADSTLGPGAGTPAADAFGDITEPDSPASRRTAEPESLASRRDLPGLVVVRSLTKTWGLAGLRIGYLLAPAGLVRQLAAVQPLWAVSTPALAAAAACATPAAVREERRIAARLAVERSYLVRRLGELPRVRVAGTPASAFVLVHLPGAARVRLALRDRGFAVRRGDTFPGLGPDWLRLAVRDTATTDLFVAALAGILEE
ncbi:Rv2231c family pyridoxal phosphate-dependent protein CobC [Micromonospora sp. WMMD1102]|uniref:Rv2231c family pyridoxal phosphate-dependent protein CobC n=1 Tax=Micromonospora sp. WMMD1102 TaxID=3016105 RepID=UPI0024158F0F|nr:Rv2231c family pyridoxal phosphate-dependent protein CobC [Micromonospora sp. WMMD1102]MDG4789411.1 Rv2231c family pyridoxal phosphate-dependent protein CobC [Micromonospora sp. WMMD1102]